MVAVLPRKALKKVMSLEHDTQWLGYPVKPFNPESWYTQHSHIAKKNEKRAQAALADGNKITASEYFLRAAGFWRSAIMYLPEADDRIMKGYSRV